MMYTIKTIAVMLTFAHKYVQKLLSLCIDVYLLFVQMKGKDGFNYRMIMELGINKFALAFMSPNNAEKYYVLPTKGSEGMIHLTLHKDPVSKDKYVFKLAPSVTFRA